MKVYIQTDIEGVAGFCFFENFRDESMENFHHRERMRHLLTDEAKAAAAGAFDAGADEVFINDSHGDGYSIFFEELDPRCRIIHGRNCSGPHWLPCLEGSDALVLIGMHAQAGTKCAITPHTLWKVNDGQYLLSEATMAAAIAGDFGIPLVFASGDDKVTAEIHAKAPGATVLAVKEALSPYQACSMIPKKAHELIRSQVADAVRRRKEITPFVIAGPVTLSEFDGDDHVPPLKEAMPPVTAPTMNEAFLAYLRSMSWNTLGSQDPDGYRFPDWR